MIILLANLIIAVVLALINVNFVISFEVAFVGALLVFYSSYKAVIKKISDYSAIMGVNADDIRDLGDSRADSRKSSGDSHKDLTNLGESHKNAPKDSTVSSDNLQDSQNSPQTTDNLPSKERFFIGLKVSFRLLRLLSYVFIALSIITLINNGVFSLIPFLLGILISTLFSAFYAIKKHKSNLAN